MSHAETDSQRQDGRQPRYALATGSAWACASAPDADQWHGPYESRDDAIAMALDYYGDEDEPEKPVWVAECRRITQADFDEIAGLEEHWTFLVTGKPERVTAADLSSPNT